MANQIKRVAAVHDLSGVGRCALTVIIPLLSVMKVQVCPVPTVVLSTHMGGFGVPASIELTQGLERYIEHWKACEMQFECLYSGYLANESQIYLVKELFKQFSTTNHPLIVVDPVMGDHGKLYSAYNEEMQACMRDLVGYADLITPNLTEAYFLLGKPYEDKPLTTHEVMELVQELSKLTKKQVVIKGIQTIDEKRINVAYDKEDGILYCVPYEEIPASYPGTGDAFASVMIGYLLQGKTLEQAVEGAASFVKAAVAYTYQAGTDSKEGILIEAMLGELINRCEA